MSKPAYKGVVKGRTVVLEKVADLPDGAEVLVTPLEAERGSPQAILAAMDAPPHVKPGDVDELMRLIDRHGGFSYAGGKAVHYARAAKALLVPFRCSPSRDALQSAADYVVERNF